MGTHAWCRRPVKKKVNKNTSTCGRMGNHLWMWAWTADKACDRLEDLRKSCRLDRRNIRVSGLSALEICALLNPHLNPHHNAPNGGYPPRRGLWRTNTGSPPRTGCTPARRGAMRKRGEQHEAACRRKRDSGDLCHVAHAFQHHNADRPHEMFVLLPRERVKNARWREPRGDGARAHTHTHRSTRTERSGHGADARYAPWRFPNCRFRPSSNLTFQPLARNMRRMR